MFPARAAQRRRRTKLPGARRSQHHLKPYSLQSQSKQFNARNQELTSAYEEIQFERGTAICNEELVPRTVLSMNEELQTKRRAWTGNLLLSTPPTTFLESACPASAIPPHADADLLHSLLYLIRRTGSCPSVRCGLANAVRPPTHAHANGFRFEGVPVPQPKKPAVQDQVRWHS